MGTETKIPTPLIDITAVSQRLGISVNTVYSWVNQRKIPYVKVGRLVRFDVIDIEKWLANNKVEPFKL